MVTVRSPREILTRQQLPYFLGISNATTGAKHLSMNLVVIPPGARAEPHYHQDFETGIYVLQGRVETRYGEDLNKSVINEAGDFIFIPPGLPHQPLNLSETETAMGIVVRNDPNEQENVVPYPINS
ncbi:MAG: cupin domain-containing protein [Gammaproteobacteria bacterium]